MTYDRDEWRRPWRSTDLPEPQEALAALRTDPDIDPEAGIHEPAQDLRAAPDVSDTSHLPPTGAWEQPDGRSRSAPTAAVDPIARFPQPPPAGWDERSDGPGSPPGSVRPPDTIGTVDAPEAPKRRRGSIAVATAALFGAVLGTLVTLVGLGVLTDEAADDAAEVPAGDVTAPAIEPVGEGSIVPAVAEAVTPSVVHIDVSGDGVVAPEGAAALGSGIIYRSDGYILTNHHVVDGAEEVRVRLSTGDILDAEIVGTDQLNDIAVILVEQDGLPAINQRDIDQEPLVVGETVVAIGSPFGLDGSVTAGVISALNRDIQLEEAREGAVESIPSVIQTDAAINPGNSGGALVDARGRLIGINTAILTRSGASQGVGFAVSADQAVRSADQLIEQGFVRHPLLGIQGNDVTPEIAEQFDVPVSRGAIIRSVQDGTGADDADLRPGDVIIEVDGEPLATMSQLVAEVRRREPGDAVELTVFRDGQTHTADVVLGERPR